MSFNNNKNDYNDNIYQENECIKDTNFKSKIYYEIKDYFENVKDKYINDESLINSIEQIFKEIPRGQINRCLECNIDMGECNPRQLCAKMYCSNS